MKILHLIFLMKMGGTESMLIDIANEQVRAGNEVSVMIINSGSDSELLALFDSNIKIKEAKRRIGSKNPLPIVRTNLEIARLNPDVIHVHNENGVNILLPSLRKRVVQTLHTTGIELRGCQTKTPLVSISQAVADDLYNRQQLNSEVIMNGVRVSAIERRRPSERLENLVCVGRMDIDVKGQDLLVRALSRIPGLTVTFIGDGADLENVKKLAHEYRVSQRINFLGAMTRKEVYGVLKNYDAFVLPSRQEGFGLVVAEAMAAGLPVITSALPGPMEVIEYGRLGLTFTPNSSSSLIGAIRRMQKNWNAFQTMALGEGVDFVEKNFSVANTAAQYLDYYRRVLSL